MQLRFLRLYIALLILTIIFNLAPRASAEYRGKFFGSYRISNVEETGDQVQLTIKIVLLNYSGEAVKNAGVVVYNTAPARAALGAFSGIASFPANGKVALSQEFTVSRSQYAAWKQGEKPVMEMLVPETGGGARLERIDLTPAPSPAAPAE